MVKLQVEYISIDELKPYEKNAKKHPKQQVKKIASSIKEFGMCDPIAVWGDKNIIIEGHGRLQALKYLGNDTAPIIRLDHLTEEQRRAYTLAHNKVAESEWDFELLDLEINDLTDFDFEKFGFQFEELEDEKPKEKKNERLRTDTAYNLPYVDIDRCFLLRSTR